MGISIVGLKKEMHGLKQAARLAYDDLKVHLSKYGYRPDPIATNIWSHNTKSTKFCLCVDDFVVQYFSDMTMLSISSRLYRQSTKLLLIRKEKNCGLQFEWNYVHGYIDISMSNYFRKILQKLDYNQGKTSQHVPHQWTVPVYGKKQQFAKPADTTMPLDKARTKYTQQVVGSFLYYG